MEGFKLRGRGSSCDRQGDHKLRPPYGSQLRCENGFPQLHYGALWRVLVSAGRCVAERVGKIGHRRRRRGGRENAAL